MLQSMLWSAQNLQFTASQARSYISSRAIAYISDTIILFPYRYIHVVFCTHEEAWNKICRRCACGIARLSNHAHELTTTTISVQLKTQKLDYGEQAGHDCTYTIYMRRTRTIITVTITLRYET